MPRINRTALPSVVVALLIAGALFSAGVMIHMIQVRSGITDVPSQALDTSHTVQNDVAVVKLAFEKAMKVHQAIVIPSVRRPGFAPDDVARQKQRENASAQISRVFAAKPAARELNNLENAIKAERDPNFRVLDSGIGKISYKNVTLADGAATVEADVETFQKMRQRDPHGVWHDMAPNATIQVKMTLTEDTAGNWVVQEFDWTFAPGSEP